MNHLAHRIYESLRPRNVSHLTEMNQSITVEELERLILRESDLQLVDVRSPGEFASGHVPRAVNIPLEQADARIDDLGPGPVAILCHSGDRASVFCEMLRAHHPRLLVVAGGTQAWINAAKPVVRTTSSRWSLERQVRLIAGLLILLGTVLATTVASGWIFLAMFVGMGLTFAGLTNFCGMALLLSRLPWNQPAKCVTPSMEVQA